MEGKRTTWREMDVGAKVGVIAVSVVCGALALGVLLVLLGLLARAIDWAWS
jgi:hypothetical protein